MTRDTKIDAMFKKRIRDEFERAIKRAQQMGMTVEQFANTLGITRAGLHKYTREKNQSIPSLRVLHKARQVWKMHVPYGDADEDIGTTKRVPKEQLAFQFSVQDVAKENITVRKVKPRGDTAVELVIQIDFTKRA
jgi:transcriptional regulator with XRE-family HTH domain